MTEKSESLLVSNVSPQDYNEMLAMHNVQREQDIVQQYPVSVFLNITDGCNQHCRFCSGNHKKASEAAFAKPEVIASMKWLGWVKEITVIGSGEALFHPHYPSIMRTIRRLAPAARITLYTNGLALNGKRLSATLECADNICISQNAVSKRVYEQVILNGNHAQTLSNLRELAEKKPQDMTVSLGLVVTRETVGEIEKMVELAATCKFNTVYARKGIFNDDLSADALPQDSYYHLHDEDYFDYHRMKQYAATRGVLLCSPSDERDCLYKPVCDSPWKEIRFNAMQGGWEIKVCCEGKVNLFASDEDVMRFFPVWNHDRLRLIRKTVNSDAILANRMCTLCRYEHSSDEKFLAASKVLLQKIGLRSARESFSPEWVTLRDRS